MFTEAINFSIVQTELDRVFYQEFNYPAGPGMATCDTAALFKPVQTTHAAHIEEVHKGVGLYDAVSEVQNVPLEAPRVTNKLTVNVQAFAKAIEISKDLFDDNMKSPYGVYVNNVAVRVV